MKKLHSFHWIVLICCYLVSTNLYAQGNCTTAIPLLPGTQQCANTMAGGDLFDDNLCLGSYAGGDDYLFVYTVPLAEDGFVMELQLSSTSIRTGIAISAGCPEAGGGVCLGSATSPAGNETLVSQALTAGQTYYVHISSLPAPQNISFCLNTLIGPVGCTNPLATNYNPLATINDGSCTFPSPTTTCGSFTSMPLDSIDNTLAIVEDTISVNLGMMEALTDLDVVLDLTHTDLSDLEIQLQSPKGTIVVLMANQCSNTSDLQLRFDDDSGALDCSNTSSGFFRPPNGQLRDFNNELVDGDWILKIIDGSGGDHGKLLQWCLLPTTNAVSCLAPTNLATPEVNFNFASLSWTDNNTSSSTSWEIELGPQGFTPTGTATHSAGMNNPYQLTGLIPETTYDFYVRSNCGMGDYSFWAGPASFSTFISNPSVCGMNLPIADNTCNANNEFLVKVNNAPADQMGINVILEEVRLIIAHPWDNDLDISLISPNGVVVELSTDNGSGDDNYGAPSDPSCGAYTAFSSDECLPVSILDGIAPFIGSYLPEGRLNDFHDGSNPNGIWKLKVCDDANGDEGFLEFVELVFATTACPAPSDLTVSQIEATSLELSWAPGGFCNQTIIEYGSPGFLPGSGSTAGAGTVVVLTCPQNFPFTLTGLNELTDYEFYLREECSPGIFSKNTCVASARTDCNTAPTSLLENFDTQTNCPTSCGAVCAISGTWQNSTADNFDWLVDSGGTTSSNTGPADDITGGGNYIYIEGSGAACQNGKRAILRSNCIGVEASTGTCHMSFNYHLFGANVNQLKLEITTDGGNTWTTLWQRLGNQGNQWEKAFIDLSTYHSLNVQFRFTGSGGAGFAGDIALDEIRFYGSLDLGASVNIFYADADTDGFGNPQDSIFSCLPTAPSGYAANKLDCNDQNALVNPLAAELPCNGLDDNCNGLVDDLVVLDPVVKDTMICQGQSVTIVSPSTAVGNLYWFEQANGGNPIATGNSFTTPILQTDQSYFLQDSSNVNPSLRITEIDLGTHDAIEIQSIGTAGDYTGWTVAVSNSYTDINIVNPALWMLGSMLNNEVAYRTDNPVDNFWGSNILWGAGAFPMVSGWAIILDAQGKVVDALFWGWPDSEIASFNTTINGYAITAAQLPWTGMGIDVSNNCSTGNTIQLTTEIEMDQATDYRNCVASNLGEENPNLGVLLACTSNRVPVNITVLAQPDIMTTDMPFICLGESFDLNTVNIVDLNHANGTISFHQEHPATAMNLLPSPIVTPTTDTSFVILSTSAGACTSETTINIHLNELPEVTIAPTGMASICNNESISLTASHAGSGASPFSYTWNTGDTGPKLTIAANANTPATSTYTVTITDAKSCTNTADFVLNVPGSITSIAVLGTTDVTTCGGTDGTITLSPVDGISPYDYAWEGPVMGVANQVAGTFNLTGLAQGSYRVTISDNSNLSCQIIVPLLIVNGPDAAVSLAASNNVSCHNGSDGAIDISTTGINPSFLWSDGATSEDLSNLSAGNYSVTVNAGVCSNVLSNIEITEPAMISTAINSLQSVSCFGGNDGAIDLQVNGGQLPYQFLWTNGATTEDLTQLNATTYRVTVTDANACTIVSPFTTLDEATPISYSISDQQAVSCAGAANGSIELLVTGGTGPYSYEWNTGANSKNLNNIPAGIYALTITDALFCQKITDPISIGQPASLSLSLNALTHPLCNTVANGSIDLQVTGGMPPYQFLWNTNATTEDITNLDQGTYVLTVTDANQCTVSSSPIVLAYANTLVASLDQLAHTTCKGVDDGSIELTVQGGQMPYQYLWSNAATTPHISGLAEGAYQLSVTDNNGCFLASSAFTIIAPQVLQLTIDSVQNISCNGLTNGLIDIAMVGGMEPYHYLWNEGTTNEDLVGLSAGNYFCEIEDDQGCRFRTDVFNITSPDSLRVDLTAIESVSCNGIADASIDVLVTGGTIPYTFLWNNGSTTEDLSEIPTGNYKLTVMDANDCVVSSPSFPVVEPAPIEIIVDRVDNVACTGEEGGLIEVSVTGGTLPYQYLWNTGQTTEDILDLEAGSYTLTVTDANNCKRLVSSILVSQLIGGLTVETHYQKDLTCNGDEDGAFAVTVTGGIGPYQYNWSNGTEYDINQATDTLQGLSVGSYLVTITDDKGCVGVSPTVTISEPTELSFWVSNVEHIQCFGEATGAIDLEITGGESPYTVVWSNDSIGKSIYNLTAGTYSFTIIDGNGCLKSSVQPLVISQPSNPIALFDIQQTNVACFGDGDGSINITPFGGIAPFFFEWSNGLFNEDLQGLSGGDYQLTITDLNNCVFISPVFTITEPIAPLVLEEDSTEVIPNLCAGEELGQLSVTPTGGTLPYDFHWSNTASTADLENLVEGVYRVTITDQNSCSIVSPWFSITTPMPLVLDTITSTATYNQADGTATVFPSGGTSPYFYAWDESAANQTNATATGLTAGNYTVTVTDNNDCTAIVELTVGNGLAPVSTQEMEALTKFVLFPNPSTGLAQLELTFKEVVQLELQVYTILGKQLRQLSFDRVEQLSHHLDLSECEAGIYLIKLKVNENQWLTKRLVILDR